MVDLSAMRALRRLMLCALLLAPRAGAAQEALVLSGGGSHGLAHAGVFVGLEELGYDPDIVVGTSMGAVVGALYAAGYEPREIEERIAAVDWQEVFTPTPSVIGPARTVRYPILTLDLDLSRLRVARGLVPQWRMNRALALLLLDANVRSRGSFDRLARRYRAIATDLKTGEPVVLAEGDLARAARASLAVPGIFAPVAWGERLLVDGGISNNLPSDVARRLGAVRIISVDVGRPTEEIRDHAPLAVIERSIDLLQANARRDTIAPDVLVIPEIDPAHGAASFPADPSPLFESGLAAARRSLRPAARDVGRGKRPLPPAPDSVAALVVEAPDSALAALARHVFAGAAPGRYDGEALAEAVDRLYTTGLLEGVWPSVVQRPGPDSAAVLLVRLDGPPKTSLSLAAGYENDRGARAWAALDRYTLLGRSPAVLTAAASLDGIEWWASASARVYLLSRTALAWSTGAYLAERDVRHFSGDTVSHENVLRTGAWAGLEFPHILRDRAATVALRAEWVRHGEGEDGLSAGPLLRFTSLNPDLLVVGVPFLAEGELRAGVVEYGRVVLRGSATARLGSLHFAAVGDVRATTADAPADVVPALGDDHSIPGLKWGEERGRATGVVGLDAARPFMGGYARLRLRTGIARGDHEGWDAERLASGAQIGFLRHTPLGAIDVGLGFASGGRRRVDVGLGRYF